MQNQFSTLIEKRKSLCIELGISLENLPKHANFLAYLWKKNQTELNIVSRKMSAEELVNQHWLDTMMALPHWPKQYQKVADLGTGGGIPGIPYAIENPGQTFYLYEKSPKKQMYLKSLKQYLNLANVIICESVDPNLNVDLITARAFKSVCGILDITKNHYSLRKPYFLFKGTQLRLQEEILEAKKKYHQLKPEILSINTRDLATERHILSLFMEA